MINFSLGLAHLHRAMQRKSDNRHLHIMQGFTFIMRYHELRGENMEASFNVARAFHQLGERGFLSDAWQTYHLSKSIRSFCRAESSCYSVLPEGTGVVR